MASSSKVVCGDLLTVKRVFNSKVDRNGVIKAQALLDFLIPRFDGYEFALMMTKSHYQVAYLLPSPGYTDERMRNKLTDTANAFLAGYDQGKDAPLVVG